MKTIIKMWGLIIFMVLGCINMSQAQSILGNWLNEEKTAKVQIFQGTDKKYYGKIVWLQNPLDDQGKPKTDKNNPNTKLRNTPLMELLMLKSFNKINDQTYEDGTIYDPKNGKTYSAIITVKGNNQLAIRGYVGVSMFGRTTVWTRSN